MAFILADLPNPLDQLRSIIWKGRQPKTFTRDVEFQIELICGYEHAALQSSGTKMNAPITPPDIDKRSIGNCIVFLKGLRFLTHAHGQFSIMHSFEQYLYRGDIQK